MGPEDGDGDGGRECFEVLIAAPNCPLRNPKYLLRETMRPRLEVHCGMSRLIVDESSLARYMAAMQPCLDRESEVVSWHEVSMVSQRIQCTFD